MVMHLNQKALQQKLQDRAGALGGNARNSHAPQISTSPPKPNDDNNRYDIHLFDDAKSNTIRLIELDDTLLTGCLDDDIEILGLCG